ncbi:MAG: hypothetical protein JJU29_17885 [Verrucomicrobia bacterium]|nr:hypothetical protein [Verrucomicrobiota bacterium]MCH8513886.1 hypothetical protein [Kiritimatiellia bacterium]
MSYYVQTRWGSSEDNPSEARMREIIQELDTPDQEHPDTWLSDDFGWTLTVSEKGVVVWENMEEETDPRYQENVSRDESLRLWLLLANGNYNEIEQEPWKYGQGPPVSNDELQNRKIQAEQIVRGIQREFYDSLGPELIGSKCGREGCVRGTIKFSVFCRPHHFENVRNEICPFND